MSDAELQRLRWQCRRGMLELDCLFSDYLDKDYLSASDDERQQFRWLLDQLDLDLQAWILEGSAAPPGQAADLVRYLRKAERPAERL